MSRSYWEGAREIGIPWRSWRGELEIDMIRMHDIIFSNNKFLNKWGYVNR